jgi:Tfp pilus assembly protein PilN
MQIKETLEHLQRYYAMSRGAGYTTQLLNGLAATGQESTIAFLNKATAIHLARQCAPSLNTYKVKGISINEVDGLQFVKSTAPLFLDNSVLQSLIQKTLEEFDKLAAEIKKLKKQNHASSSRAKDLEDAQQELKALKEQVRIDNFILN